MAKLRKLWFSLKGGRAVRSQTSGLLNQLLCGVLSLHQQQLLPGEDGNARVHHQQYCLIQGNFCNNTSILSKIMDSPSMPADAMPCYAMHNGGGGNQTCLRALHGDLHVQQLHDSQGHQ